MIKLLLSAACLFVAMRIAAQTVDIHQRVMLAIAPAAKTDAERLMSERRYVDVEGLLDPMRVPHVEELALRGVLEFLGGRIENASRLLSQSETLAELNDSDRFTLAMAYVQLGQDEQARRELSRLSERQPDIAVYVYWLGRIDYDQRRYVEAVKQLSRATELDAKSARAWDSLGLAYDMQGDAGKARQAFEEAVRVNRDQTHRSSWPPNDLGALLLRTGDIKQAEVAFQEALTYDPNMEQAHYHLGRALEKDGAEKEALQEYSTAMDEDKKAADVCYSLAMLYRKLGRDKDADIAFAEWRRRRDAQQ